MQILHFADVHAIDKSIDEVEKCLKEILRVAQAETPDLIVMAGDTFDSRMVRLDSQSAKLVFEIYSKLADIAPMVVITGTPSHDGRAVDAMEHIRSGNPIYVADYPGQVILTNSGGFAPTSFAATPEAAGEVAALISTVPTPTKQYWEKCGGETKSAKETDAEVAQAMSAMLANFGAVAEGFDVPHILIGHFSVGGAFLSETQQLIGQDIELSRDQIRLANADLVTLGHIHYPQEIEPNIYYSGSIYTKDFGEAHPHGCYLHTLENKTLAESQFIPTPTRKLVKLKADMTNGDHGSSIQDVIEKSNGDIAGAFVRLEVKVYQDEADAIDKEAIKQALPPGALELEIKLQRVPRETVRSATLLEMQTLRDKIREMALLRKEDVPESILAKADMLEHLEHDELCKAVGQL